MEKNKEQSTMELMVSEFVEKANNEGIEQGKVEARKEAIEALIPLLEKLSRTNFTFKQTRFNEWTIYKDNEPYKIVGGIQPTMANAIMEAHEKSYVEGCHETIMAVLEILKKN